MFPLDAGRTIWPPWGLMPLLPGMSLNPVLLTSSPNTDMNEGMGGTIVLEPALLMLGRRLLWGRCPDRGERLPGWVGQFGELELRVGRGNDSNSRSHFFEGRNVLGTRSGVNALLRVGLSALCTIVVVAIAE